MASVLPASARTDLTLQFSQALKTDTFLTPDKMLIGNEEYFAVRKPFFRNQKLLQILITQPNHEVMSVYSLIRQTLIFMGAFPLIIALIAALLFSRKLTRPLKELSSAAKRIQDGDYEQTVTIDTSDEFNEFAIAFNSMQKEIEARETRIAYQAKHDGLTGLYNREFAIDNLGAASEAAYRWLQNHGIDRAQGYYWSKAIPAEELSHWVSNFIGGSTQVLQTVDFVNT